IVDTKALGHVIQGTHQEVLPPVSPLVAWYFSVFTDPSCPTGRAQYHAAGPGNKPCTAYSMSNAYISFNGHTTGKALCLFADTVCNVNCIEQIEVLDRECYQIKKATKSYKVVADDDMDSCLPELPDDPPRKKTEERKSDW
ncbi:MAG: hypothetical protein L6R38_004416, partial [Xanthoria sp. 2 TBL-2021]